MHTVTRRLPFASTLALLALLAAVGMPAAAQQLDVPVTVPQGDGQMANCASSYVDGLNPNGDNFLAVRTGPGSTFAKIDEIHTGDVVMVCDGNGPWFGVFYDGSNTGNGYRATHRQRAGWVHSRYLRPLAG
jgi:Bacterial SH3 domain